MDPAAVEDAVSYAATHGILMVAPSSPDSFIHAPFTLSPSPLPRSAFDHACALARPFNSLVHSLATHPAFLSETLKETAEADASFTGRLLAMHTKLSPAAASTQVATMALLRCDYFITPGEPAGLRQVEINAIAASFGCLGTRTSAMHRRATLVQKGQSLPENRTEAGLSRAIGSAYAAFVEERGRTESANIRRRVVFIVQGGERNRFDQDLLRFALEEEHGIPTARLTLREVAERGRLVYDDGEQSQSKADLVIGGADEYVAAVVYFRAGYGPGDYSSALEWDARECIERSTAIKCPNVATQLVGAKKVQQVLDSPGVVEKFSADLEEANLMRTCFVRQFTLTDESIEMVMAKPEDYVLKPQREGGGNNLYSEEMKRFLEHVNAEEKAAYILMERIRPLEVPNTIVREGTATRGAVVGELGIFGAFLNVGGRMLLNEQSGFLLRSKFAAVDDGGVAAGVAVLDSPLLIG